MQSRARCRRSFHMIHNRLEPSSRNTEEEDNAPIPVVPVRYSMDKAFVHALPAWRNYSTGEPFSTSYILTRFTIALRFHIPTFARHM